MNTLLKFLAAPLFLLMITSCQKEITDQIIGTVDSTGNAGGSGYLVKTYTENITSPSDNFSITYNLTYDADNRIKSLVSAASAGDKILYQYGTNKYSMDLYNSNVLSIHEDFIINSIGFVDSTTQYNDGGDSTTEKYIYNAQKLLVQLKEYEKVPGMGMHLFNTTNYTYDANGNITNEKSSVSETKYDYYTNLPDNLNVGQVYFSRNKNLTKTTYLVIPFADTINHTYTFDSLNRLSSEKAVSTSGNTIIKTYTY